MKKLVAALLLPPLVLLLIGGLAIIYALQEGMVSRSDLAFLLEMGQREGPGAVIAVVRNEVYGVDESNAGDPSYGRRQIVGRGHAPWVIRGNLDGRPRILKFALAPRLWAAYDTEQLSLYQVWQGDLRFEGAAYDYRHGPQPVSAGAWFWRDTAGSRWFIEVEGVEIAATVQYLGHEYGQNMQTAAMRFALHTADYRLELTEQPDIVEREGTRYLARQFARTDKFTDIKAGFVTGQGKRYFANGTVELAMTATTPITVVTGPSRGRVAESSELEQGEAVIANSDCLSCHAASHPVTGPSWSQVAGKFRGKLQEEVITALTQSVLRGSVGTWGQIPMPPHATLSATEAAAAVAYVLSAGEPETDLNAPLNEKSEPYSATRSYDVLPRLTSLHPSFRLENLAPAGFEPKVGGMAFRGDGKLLVASWDRDGAVFLIDLEAPADQRVKRIAEGLQEPLGLAIADNRLFVLQKQELTELIDSDGDDIIDRYRSHSYDWPSGSNFHSFAFGLLYQDDAFYFLLSICVLPGGASCPEQLPTQGKLLRADMNGNVDIVASGFRTPNGITAGPNGAIYVADNQGDWLPASKIARVMPGDFFGSRAVPDAGVMSRTEKAPVVWLPQDEVGNSPTQPLFMIEGPYAGQLLHGDVYNGGIKRVFLEEVGGRQQGAVFHFSAGFQGGVNRLVRGPEGAIYVGEVGNPPNWGEYDKSWYGLERLTYSSNETFEILAVRARSDGFTLELTQPLAAELQLTAADLIVRQWFYHPNEQYGGPKYDETNLQPSALTVSEDRRQIHVQIPGLKAGYVVYLRLHERMRSASDNKLWAAEAWYTLNNIPDAPTAQQAQQAQPSQQSSYQETQSDDGWRVLFDGKTLEGWRNYGGDENNISKWLVEDGNLTLKQTGVFPMWDLIASVIFGGASGDLIYYREKFRDFELRLQWKIAPGGNSGIFYLVADETENTPWLTGVEMQVLDNDGHDDGQIRTHRAGDLYDLIAAVPETVRAPGEWNDVRIRLHNNHIEHWLNGVKVVSTERGSAQWNALVAASKFSDMPRFGRADAGYIVLQDHGDKVWYRNIRVRTP